MQISRNITIVYIVMYIIVFSYLIAFLLIPSFQIEVIESRKNLMNFTVGNFYFWALLISFFICLIGSMSIGFPIPFPFVLFSLSNSILIKYNYTLNLFFWMEISGIIIIGGLGAFIGEASSYLIGKGARIIAEKRDSQTLENVKGFGKLVLKNPKRTRFYIFLGAATPIPDDVLIISLSMLTDENGKALYPFYKIIIPGWLGKNITTLIYCMIPLLLYWGINVAGFQTNALSDIITETIMLLVTISVMYFIMAFDWNKYIDKISNKKDE